MLRRLTPWLLLACLGCDPAPPPGEPQLEVGTGQDSFNSFVDGDTLALVSGCQGSQHVWTALRAWGIDPRGTILDLSVTRDRDEMIVSQTFVVRVSMTEVAGTDYAEVFGLTLALPEPDQVLNEALTVHATVTATDGTSLSSDRSIFVAWGTGGCR
jgi:hypothetical protein